MNKNKFVEIICLQSPYTIRTPKLEYWVAKHLVKIGYTIIWSKNKSIRKKIVRVNNPYFLKEYNIYDIPNGFPDLICSKDGKKIDVEIKNFDDSIRPCQMKYIIDSKHKSQIIYVSPINIKTSYLEKPNKKKKEHNQKFCKKCHRKKTRRGSLCSKCRYHHK